MTHQTDDQEKLLLDESDFQVYVGQHREENRETEKQRDKNIDRHTYKQTSRQTNNNSPN